MSEPHLTYESAMAGIHSVLRSDRVGLVDWPEDLQQQEQRILFFSVCFFDAQKQLENLSEDFKTNPPPEERKNRDDPIPTHTDMWLCMYEAAEKLTQPGILRQLTLLRGEGSGQVEKTVELLRPVMVWGHDVTNNLRRRFDEINQKYAGVLECGPQVSQEVANSMRYLKWKRSYAVLKDMVNSLYAALEKIKEWVTYKIYELRLSAGTEAEEKKSQELSSSHKDMNSDT